MTHETAAREPEAGGSQVPWLLTPAEVALLFRVDPKTVTRWAKARKLTTIRTAGGHRRYPTHEVRALFIESLSVALGGQYGSQDLERAFGNALAVATSPVTAMLPALEAPRA